MIATHDREDVKTRRSVRLTAPDGPAALVVEETPLPQLGSGDALVRVHAAGITRGELGWPVDRLPAIPSYELSGVVAAVGSGVTSVAAGTAVWALTPFDRDGVATDFAAVPAAVLSPKPRRLAHTQCAAVPLAALSAWQGLFDHGRLQTGQRVLVHGAGGGVGRFAVQLARWGGAHVIGTASTVGLPAARDSGAHEVVDRSGANYADGIEPLDLVFDTVGGAALSGSAAVLRPGGRIVSVAQQPPSNLEAIYFVVEPRRDQLEKIARLVDDGTLNPMLDSVFPLTEARAAFERVGQCGKHGKIVLEVVNDDART